METPEGLRWLHQLVLVAHFSITLQGAGGIRVVCQFLELSGLSAFVGASYGTQQGLNAALEEALVAVAEEQRAALARGMPHRDLTVCEDETFHPQMLQIEALALPPDLECALVEPLIPALYLERVAARSTRAEPRHRLRALSHQLLEPLRHGDHPLQALPSAERARLEQVAGECADRFQRSSSGVEGRNGQLAMHHQGRHRLSDRKLAAITAVHNDHLRRAEGTTTAERWPCPRNVVHAGAPAHAAVPTTSATTTSTAQAALSDAAGGVGGWPER